jgi:hypothetical protein
MLPRKTSTKIELTKYILLKSTKNIIHVISITLWKKLDNNIFKVYVNLLNYLFHSKEL